MLGWLRQSTAVDVPLGPFTDELDGVTPETGLTISQADVRLKKGAGSWAQKADATAGVHEENGWYEVSLNATDTATLGELTVAVHEAGALPVWRHFTVVPPLVYDTSRAVTQSWLRQSTAVDLAFGPFLDGVDGRTPETALAITQADVRLKKGAGAWAAKNSAAAATHEENGWYEVSLDATDTGTLGELMVAVNAAGALPVWRTFRVVPAAVYDAYLTTPTPGSRILDVCDAAVAYLDSVLPVGSATVSRTYDPLWNQDVSGRVVNVVPDPRRARVQLDTADRGRDLMSYTFWVVCFERYTSNKPVPDSWTDERVKWFETYVLEGLSDVRNVTLLSGDLWPDSDELEALFDGPLLTEDGWWWAAALFTFAEVAA